MSATAPTTGSGYSARTLMLAGAPRFGPSSAPSVHDKLQRRIGNALTPVYISSVLRRGDTGDLAACADMLDEIRETDPHLHSVLFKREAQVAGAAWEIRPSRRASSKNSRRDKVVEFCTDVLENLPGFAQTLAHLQSGVYHGRAAAENVWRRDGARWIIDAIEPIHARRLAYAANNWKLHLWDTDGGTAYGKFPGVPFDAFPKGKMVVHRPRTRGGYPTREGLGRVVVWYSVFKRWTQRDWMALAEMTGRPGRVGYFGTGAMDPAKGGLPEATDEDKKLLEDSLLDWSSAVSVVLPDTVRLDFQNAISGAGDLHKVLADQCNAEMSKAVLGETLTTEAGTRGARSLGDIHDDVRLMIAVWDAKCLAETVRYYILAPLVRLNFGEGTPVPDMVFTVEPSENLNAVAERFGKLAAAGLDIDQEYVRDIFGIPEPAESVRLMIPRAPAVVTATGEEPAPEQVAAQGSTPRSEKAGPAKKLPKGASRGGAPGGTAGGAGRPAKGQELE